MLSDKQSDASVRSHNRQAWDAMVAHRDRFTRPADDADFRDPLGTVDPLGWLEGNIRGKNVLALAAGGGRQSALYAAAGAHVTVVDISPEMLTLDRQVAAERGLTVRTVEASMDDLSALPAASFDIVIHPVSTCYLPDIAAVYRQIARVTRPAGLYISQHKSPTSLQATVRPGDSGHYSLVELYYRSGPLPPVAGSRHREPGMLEFLHRWEEILGGMCHAGFVIEDVVEPLHAEADAAPGTFAHRSRCVAPYIRIKARRTGPAAETAKPTIQLAR